MREDGKEVMRGVRGRGRSDVDDDGDDDGDEAVQVAHSIQLNCCSQ